MTIKHDHPAKQASYWFVRLSSENANDSDYHQWQSWMEASPDNEAAWRKIEQLTSQLKGFSSESGVVCTLRRLYDKPTSESRRVILKQLAVLIPLGTTAYLTYGTGAWNKLIADYSTATGEVREVALVDGTRLYLNTATVLNVEFDDNHRTVTLLKGEILIQTGHEKGKYRPFIVKTEQGSITALGTRFNVRDHLTFSRVDVFDGAVRIAPTHDKKSVIVEAGHSMKFNAYSLEQEGSADATLTAWFEGYLIVDQKTLGELVIELSRYRSGILKCDPRIAGHKVSGSFPTDTDAALLILSHKFPIKIKACTRYWTELIPS